MKTIKMLSNSVLSYMFAQAGLLMRNNIPVLTARISAGEWRHSSGMKKKLRSACVLAPILVGIIVGTEGQIAKRYQRAIETAGEPTGQIVPLLGTQGFEISADGPAPIQPSWDGSHYMGRLGDRGEFQWGLTSYALQYGRLEMRIHPSEPLVFASLVGLVDEEFWTVFGLFEGRTGTRRFERGFRVIVNKVGQNTFLPRPSNKITFFSSGRIAFLVDDQSDSIKAAVLDCTANPIWQKAFVSPQFRDTSGQSLKIALVENLKKDVWCLLDGSRSMVVGKASRPLHIVRFNAEGTILWKQSISGFPSPASADLTIADAGGGLLLFRIAAPASPPSPSSSPTYTSSLAYLNPEGRILWAREFPNISANKSPVWSPDNSSLYLSMAKPVGSTTPSVESWLVKLDAKTGEIARMAQVGDELGTETTIIGASDGKVFLLRYKYSAPSGAFAGFVDTNFKNPIWSKINQADYKSSPAASYDSATDRLFVSLPKRETGWVDLVALKGDLRLAGSVSIGSNSDSCGRGEPDKQLDQTRPTTVRCRNSRYDNRSGAIYPA
jgi:hypothetical protein